MAKKTPPRPDGSGKSAFREYVEAIGTALLLALTLRLFIIEAFRIPSGSMIETLAIGDFIFVNKMAYRSEIPWSIATVPMPYGGTTLKEWSMPERGDIVVFRFPGDPSVDYIKRVVGLPGDTIEVKKDRLFVNGEAQPTKFVQSVTYNDQRCHEHKAQLYTQTLYGKEHSILTQDGPQPLANFGPVTVKEGHLFMMGDNRDNSSDSRVWGQLPFGNVKGKALFVWLSVDGCGGLMDRVRWSRFGHILE